MFSLCLCLQGHWCVAAGPTEVLVEGKVALHDVIVVSHSSPATGRRADPSEPGSLQNAVAVALANKSSLRKGSVRALVMFGLNAAHLVKQEGNGGADQFIEELRDSFQQADQQLKVSRCVLAWQSCGQLVACKACMCVLSCTLMQLHGLILYSKIK